MSHFLVDYSKLKGQDKVDKALADVKDYAGEDRYNLLVQSAQRCRTAGDRRFLEQSIAMLIGVTGYPLEVFLDTYCPDDIEPDSVPLGLTATRTVRLQQRR